MYRALGFHVADGTFTSSADSRMAEIRNFLNNLREHD